MSLLHLKNDAGGQSFRDALVAHAFACRASFRFRLLQKRSSGAHKGSASPKLSGANFDVSPILLLCLGPD